MAISGECFFLDVGQGTANVVLLGGGRAIVVDCGPPEGWPVLQRVLHRHVTTIEALILSHNDKDHVGAAPNVIAKYPKAIRRIFRVQDREIQSDKIATLLRHELKKGNLLREPISVCCEDKPRLLFDDLPTGVQLISVSPTHWETQEAQFQRDPNLASAVVELKCGDRRIVFAGDSSVGQWRTIHRQNNGPLRCDVLAVSHHGGCCWADGTDEVAELGWLYCEGIQAKHAVISVGTTNRFRTKTHPYPSVVSAIRSSGAVILCTQITTQCCPNLEELRPGVRLPETPSRSSPKRDVSSKGRSRNVACAGTVVAEISPTEVRIRRLDEHQTGVETLCASGANVLCRTH